MMAIPVNFQDFKEMVNNKDVLPFILATIIIFVAYNQHEIKQGQKDLKQELSQTVETKVIQLDSETKEFFANQSLELTQQINEQNTHLRQDLANLSGQIDVLVTQMQHFRQQQAQMGTDQDPLMPRLVAIQGRINVLQEQVKSGDAASMKEIDELRSTVNYLKLQFFSETSG